MEDLSRSGLPYEYRSGRSADVVGAEAYEKACSIMIPPRLPIAHVIASVNRSHCFLRHHAMAAEDAMALAECLKINQVITALDLVGNNVGEEGAASLMRALTLGGRIKELDLSENNIGSTLSTAHISRLRRQQMKIDSEYNANAPALSLSSSCARGRLFAEALQNNYCLVALSLSKNNLNNAFVNRLCTVLVGEREVTNGTAVVPNTTLHTLDLSHNRITGAGAASALVCLAVRSGLRKLLLAWNKLGNSGARMLLSGIARDDGEQGDCDLVHLDLSFNAIGDEQSCPQCRAEKRAVLEEKQKKAKAKAAAKQREKEKELEKLTGKKVIKPRPKPKPRARKGKGKKKKSKLKKLNLI